MKSFALFCTAALLLSLGACGKDENSKDEENETAVRSMTAVVLKDNAGDGGDLDDEQARCIAERLVDKIGTRDLQYYDLLDLELKPDRKRLSQVTMEPDDASEAAHAFVTCVDFDKLLGAVGGQGSTLSPRLQKCIKLLNSETVEALLEAGFAGDDQTAAKLFRPVTACALNTRIPADPTPSDS